MRRTKTTTVLLLCAIMLPAAARAQQACEGRDRAGDLGIRQLICDGGPCAIYGRDARGLYHWLSTEPRLAGIDRDGPSANLVRENDVLVAVDQVLVTTRDGGRRLAQLEANVPVELWLRRDGHDVRVTVTPRLGCGFLGLRVRGR